MAKSHMITYVVWSVSVMAKVVQCQWKVWDSKSQTLPITNFIQFENLRKYLLINKTMQIEYISLTQPKGYLSRLKCLALLWNHIQLCVFLVVKTCDSLLMWRTYKTSIFMWCIVQSMWFYIHVIFVCFLMIVPFALVAVVFCLKYSLTSKNWLGYNCKVTLIRK